MDFFDKENFIPSMPSSKPIDERNMSTATKILHDLCSSVSVVLSVATHLDGTDPSKLQEYRDIIIRNSYIFLNKLDIATNLLESCSLSAHLSQFNVTELIADIIILLSPHLQRSECNLDTETCGNTILAYGSSELISKAVFGLIAVAIQYHNEKSSIKISMDSDDEFCNIAVSFVSRSIASATSDKNIFDTYLFEDSADVQFASACLSLCQSCLSRSNSQIVHQVKSKSLNKFTVSIPLRPKDNLLILRSDMPLSKGALRTGMYTAFSHLFDFNYEKNNEL